MSTKAPWQTPFFFFSFFLFAVAAVATQMNCELNGAEPLVCLTKNMIGCRTETFDLILLGDMFYDEALSCSLHSWLDLCIKSHGTKVLIGDPGRAQFEEHGIRQSLRRQAQYELPASVREENYGLTCSTVWSYHPETWAINLQLIDVIHMNPHFTFLFLSFGVMVIFVNWRTI